MKAEELFKQSHLGLILVPLTIRELFFLSSSPCDIYIFEDGEFKLLIKKGFYLDSNVLKEVIQSGHVKVFTQDQDRKLIREQQQTNLRTITRSFSMGNTMENCRRQLSLLALNLRYLYEDPTNDETLNLQYQSLRILFKFLYDNPKKHEEIYLQFIKQGHHYIFTQPFVSSLFLLGILKQSHTHSEKDVENLFLTSYFKDIGMSAIPVEKYDQEELTDSDKRILQSHAQLSVQILQGRIQLSPAHFKIMEVHHGFSELEKELSKDDQYVIPTDTVVVGFETMMVNAMDIIAAMISPRPYRESLSIFQALDKIKRTMSEQYPQEFKHIVNYFRNFFSNTVS